MQLFKAFFKIAKRHLPGISIYFIIYAIITFILGSTSQQNIDQNFQSSALDICVIDEDQSEASQALTAYLDSIHNLVSLENDPELLQDNLYYRYISYILTIPEGFEEKLLDGDTDNLLSNVKIPGSTTGYFVDQQVNEYLQSLQLYLVGGYSLSDAATNSFHQLTTADNVKSVIFQEDNVASNKEVFYFYQFLPYIYIVLFLSGMAPILILFHKKELAERTNCSSASLISQNIQLALGCLTYSLCIWVAFFLLSYIAYGSSLFTENALYALLNSLTFLLVASSITLFISNCSPDSNSLPMIANIVSLSMSFLGGVFVQQSMLSESVLNVAKFLPTYWYIRANDMLAGFSTDLFDISLYWTSIGIQLLFAAAFLALTLVTAKFFKQKHS